MSAKAAAAGAGPVGCGCSPRHESGDLVLELKNESLELGRSRVYCCHGCLSSGRNNYLSAFGEAMETSCNRDSLGSVGLDLQEFDEGGKLALICRSSTEAANSH